MLWLLQKVYSARTMNYLEVCKSREAVEGTVGPPVPPVGFLFEGLADPRCILLSPNIAFCVCRYPPTMDRGGETCESVLFVCKRRAEN